MMNHDTKLETLIVNDEPIVPDKMFEPDDGNEDQELIFSNNRTQRRFPKRFASTTAEPEYCRIVRSTIMQIDL